MNTYQNRNIKIQIVGEKNRYSQLPIAQQSPPLDRYSEKEEAKVVEKQPDVDSGKKKKKRSQTIIQKQL